MLRERVFLGRHLTQQHTDVADILRLDFIQLINQSMILGLMV